MGSWSLQNVLVRLFFRHLQPRPQIPYFQPCIPKTAACPPSPGLQQQNPFIKAATAHSPGALPVIPAVLPFQPDQAKHQLPQAAAWVLSPGPDPKSPLFWNVLLPWLTQFMGGQHWETSPFPCLGPAPPFLSPSMAGYQAPSPWPGVCVLWGRIFSLHQWKL